MIDLRLGDCLEILKTLEPGSVDAVVTDPPYGIGRVWKGGGSCGWGKAKECTLHRNIWDAKPAELGKILAIGVPTVVWGGNYFPLPQSRGWLVWNKPERNFTLSEAELAWTNQDTPIRVCDCRRSDPGREHPTQKPVALMRWCIERLKIAPGSTILDPYMGSGTTGVACVQAGMNFIGIEIDPGYYAIAQKRIADEQAKTALLDKAIT